MSTRKARKRPGNQTPGRTRKTIALPTDLARRLAAFAAWHGLDEQQVIADALTPVLAGFYVATRGQEPRSEDPSTAEPLRVAG